VVISSVTASFFVRPDVPYAIRFDAPAALNRSGYGGAWQRAIEPRVLAKADVLLPWSEEAVKPLGLEAIPLGVPIERIPAARTRDIAALAYAGNPHKRGLELLARAWRLPGQLVVGGIDAAQGRAWLARHGVPEPPGLEWAGVLPRREWLALLGRTRLFVQTSRFEDHGIAPLEALSAGAKLVSVPTPGPFPALRMARELAPELVAPERTAESLVAALLAGGALDDPDYASKADALLGPHRPEALQRTVEERVLPRLL
jgi:glycosyltransferase involved in cell wall biosynthesis